MKHLIVILVLVASYHLAAQKPTVKFGPEFKTSKKATLDDIIGYDKTGFYTLEREARGLMMGNVQYTLRQFSHAMAPMKDVDVDLEYQNKDRGLEFFVQIDNELYMFTSFANQKLKRNFLFAETINKKTLLPSGKLIKIAEIDYSGYSKWNRGAFHHAFSHDSSKLLIYYDLPYERGERERFGLTVYNDSLKEIWSRDVRMPYADNLLDIQRWLVSDDGEVYLLGLKFKEVRRYRRQGDPNYNYLVLSYTRDGEDAKEYPVQLAGRFITDMQIDVTD
jgi:hypothetical protein